MTPDHNPVIGAAGLAGLYAIAGFSGHEQMGFVSIGSVINRLVYTVLAFVMMYQGQGPNQSKGVGPVGFFAR